MNKHDLESRVAQRADGGVIVEIGVGGGNGVRALWHGTRKGRQLHIYAVDPYAPYTDLNGANYGPETEEKFYQMLAADPQLAQDVVHVKADGETAGRDWPGYPVSMVWIDMADPEGTLRGIVDAWLPHIVPGGYLCINNLEYKYRGVGAWEVGEYVQGLGWEVVDIEGQMDAAILRKPLPRRVVLYLIHGEQYVQEAITSARSARRYMPSADTALYCHPGAAAGNAWTHLRPTLTRQRKTWYCDSVAYLLQAMRDLEEYDEILHLDCDTLIAYPADETFLVLQEADLAFGHGSERDNHKSLYGAPAAFTTPMVGVNLYRNTAKVRMFVQRWLELYEANEDFYGENEQYPLRDLLWKNEMGMRYVVLPHEFACRYNFGTWAKGMVRVMHGRLPLLDKTLEQAAAELNSDHTMRMYHPRFGFLWSVEMERQGRMG